MIRALIVLDVTFYREGLEELLSRSGHAVVTAVSGAADAEKALIETSPDVVLLDISAPDARETLLRLRARAQSVKVVALATNENPQSVLEWIEAGVAGYVPRTASSGELIHILRDVARDELHCSPQITSLLVRRLASLAAAQRRPQSVNVLTAREREVLDLLANGLPNKVIAARLGIASATAKNHVHNILEKLGIRGRIEAAAIVHRDAFRIHQP